MAVYFLRSKHLSRAKGARATRAAAYRAGERIRDQRHGETYDYSGRNDVVHKEVVLPAELARVLAQQKQERIDGVRSRSPTLPRRELTRQERNTRRREKYAAWRARLNQDPLALERRRAAARRAYHMLRQKNPEAIREQVRRYRAANIDEVNRKQREYRKLHGPELNARRRELRRVRAAQLEHSASSPAPEKPTAPTAEDSARAWLAYRQQHGTGPTAVENRRAFQWFASITHSEQLRTEAAVMASEIERLPDLQGFLKIASEPDWCAVTLTRCAAPADPGTMK